MASASTIWIVITLDDAAIRVRDLLDRGYFAEAKAISEAMKALADRVVSMVESIGGHAYVILNERQVLEVPLSFAEQLPHVIEGFKTVLGDKLACGMGLNFEEAASAAGKSKNTGKIELYEEESDEQDNERTEADADVNKADRDELPINTLEVPPNLFDTYNQEYKEDATPQIAGEKVIPASRMSVEESLQGEAKYLQAVGQTLGAPSQEQMQQQMAQMQQAQQQQQQQPQDLMEALNGGPVEGHTPEKPGEKKEGGGGKKESESEKPEDEEDESEGHEKLGKLLLSVKEKIPELMELQDKNPAAFKSATSLIHKLINLARDRKKTEKSESSEFEELQKALSANLKLKLPVGAVRNRRKKVIVHGKAVWRSMISGETKDSVTGQPISIRSANAAAKKGTSGESGGK